MAPRTIVLMRHAEKPPDKSHPGLTEAGRGRAKRIAALVPELIGKPDVLFAAADKPGSVRPRETLEPLAAATGVEIRQFPDRESRRFAEMLLSGSEFAGKRIVISWRHKELPRLARALGAPPGLYPDPWPESLYDLMLRFDCDASGKVEASALKEPPEQTPS
jgi:broad specificity phosphatase PhoE